MKSFFLLLVSVLMILGLSITSYALTPYDQMKTIDTFDDGPWTGATGACSIVDSSGNLLDSMYALPSWRSGSGLGTNYYQLPSPSNKYTDFYLFDYYDDHSVSNVCIVSSDPLFELYAVDASGAIVGNILEDSLLTEYGGKYFYGVSLSAGTGIGLRTGSTTYLSELSTAFNGGNYHDVIMDNIPYVGGVYDGNAVAVRYPGILYYRSISLLSAGYGYDYAVFPVFVNVSSGGQNRIDYMFASGDGLLNNGTVYNFQFKAYNCGAAALYLADTGAWYPCDISGNLYTTSVAPTYDTNLSNLVMGFVTGTSNGPSAYCLVYESSSSDDIGTIPPDDSGDGSGSSSPDYSSSLLQIGNRLEELMFAVSDSGGQIIYNITNQTTQITNTITNTVTNMTQQIKQGLSDVKQGITDKLQGVEEGISGTIEDANKEQIENDQKLHDEQIKADQENTEKVESAIEEHGNFIIDGLKGLFIPSDEFFKSYFDDLYDYFSDRFGFLSFPVDLVIRIADLFLTSEKVDAVLTLPSFEISGYKVWEDYSFNFTEFLETSFPFLISAIQTVTSIGLIMAFVNLCQDKWNEVMRS